MRPLLRFGTNVINRWELTYTWVQLLHLCLLQHSKCFRSWLRSEIESPTSLTYSELFREENRHDWFRSGALVNSWIKPVCGDFADRFYLKEARISIESFWVVLNLTCFVYILLPVWVVSFAAGSAQSVERLIAERKVAGSIARTKSHQSHATRP